MSICRLVVLFFVLSYTNLGLAEWTMQLQLNHWNELIETTDGSIQDFAHADMSGWGLGIQHCVWSCNTDSSTYVSIFAGSAKANIGETGLTVDYITDSVNVLTYGLSAQQLWRWSTAIQAGVGIQAIQRDMSAPVINNTNKVTKEKQLLTGMNLQLVYSINDQWSLAQSITALSKPGNSLWQFSLQKVF